MPFVSKPKELSVPDEPFYPAERLFLFDRHTRASWEQTFGEQAPPWNKDRRIKRWADTTALERVSDPDNQLVEYSWFDQASASFKRMTLTAREAATPNLPGRYVYPKHQIAPTPAVVVGPAPLDPAPIRADILSHRAEAEALKSELGGEEVVEGLTFTTGPFRIDWRGETRRQWLIKIGGDYHNAASLLAMKNAHGVGAPGKWEKTRTGPVWLSFAQETGEQDPRPEIPIPCRPLDPVEAIYRSPFGVVIFRRDRESVYNPKPAAQGGLTVEQSAMLARIDAGVQQLLVLNLATKR